MLPVESLVAKLDEPQLLLDAETRSVLRMLVATWMAATPVVQKLGSLRLGPNVLDTAGAEVGALRDAIRS